MPPHARAKTPKRVDRTCAYEQCGGGPTSYHRGGRASQKRKRDGRRGGAPWGLVILPQQMATHLTEHAKRDLRVELCSSCVLKAREEQLSRALPEQRAAVAQAMRSHRRQHDDVQKNNFESDARPDDVVKYLAMKAKAMFNLRTRTDSHASAAAGADAKAQYKNGATAFDAVCDLLLGIDVDLRALNDELVTADEQRLSTLTHRDASKNSRSRDKPISMEKKQAPIPMYGDRFMYEEPELRRRNAKAQNTNLELNDDKYDGDREELESKKAATKAADKALQMEAIRKKREVKLQQLVGAAKERVKREARGQRRAAELELSEEERAPVSERRAALTPAQHLHDLWLTQADGLTKGCLLCPQTFAVGQLYKLCRDQSCPRGEHRLCLRCAADLYGGSSGGSSSSSSGGSGASAAPTAAAGSEADDEDESDAIPLAKKAKLHRAPQPTAPPAASVSPPRQRYRAKKTKTVSPRVVQPPPLQPAAAANTTGQQPQPQVRLPFARPLPAQRRAALSADAIRLKAPHAWGHIKQMRLRIATEALRCKGCSALIAVGTRYRSCATDCAYAHVFCADCYDTVNAKGMAVGSSTGSSDSDSDNSAAPSPTPLAAAAPAPAPAPTPAPARPAPPAASKPPTEQQQRIARGNELLQSAPQDVVRHFEQMLCGNSGDSKTLTRICIICRAVFGVNQHQWHCQPRHCRDSKTHTVCGRCYADIAAARADAAIDSDDEPKQRPPPAPAPAAAVPAQPARSAPTPSTPPTRSTAPAAPTQQQQQPPQQQPQPRMADPTTRAGAPNTRGARRRAEAAAREAAADAKASTHTHEFALRLALVRDTPCADCTLIISGGSVCYWCNTGEVCLLRPVTICCGCADKRGVAITA